MPSWPAKLNFACCPAGKRILCRQACAHGKGNVMGTGFKISPGATVLKKIPCGLKHIISHGRCYDLNMVVCGIKGGFTRCLIKRIPGPADKRTDRVDAALIFRQKDTGCLGFDLKPLFKGLSLGQSHCCINPCVQLRDFLTGKLFAHKPMNQKGFKRGNIHLGVTAITASLTAGHRRTLTRSLNAQDNPLNKLHHLF